MNVGDSLEKAIVLLWSDGRSLFAVPFFWLRLHVLILWQITNSFPYFLCQLTTPVPSFFLIVHH
ncbi:hypothetical protein [Hyella patelloides]|uniref:hypothetical protein n=1 Tax=Hyella patelloides TaxID=1982969 RepID=UPI0011A925E7|nr:hypothetical protein [Hyella patelloides]